MREGGYNLWSHIFCRSGIELHLQPYNAITYTQLIIRTALINWDPTACMLATLTGSNGRREHMQTRTPLTLAPQVRQDLPASTVPRRQHDTFLCHAPRLL